jgi:two-component system, OmpR family, sensor histidine kinase VicK
LVVYALSPGQLRDVSTSWVMLLMGGLALGYYLSIHQFLKRVNLGASTLVLTGITLTNIILIIAQTGGLDSPYNALLILAVVVAGLFGTRYILAALLSAASYYGYEILSHGLRRADLTSHLPQFGLILLSGGMAHVLLRRTQKSAGQKAAVASLSGQLGEEQLKAQVLMNSMGEGVVVVTPSRQIQLFNPAACNLTGWDAESASGLDYRTVMGLRTPDDQELSDLNDPFVAAWQSKTTVIRSNLSVTTKGGHKVALTMTVSPILDSRGSVTGGIALFRDISQEKEVERQRNEFISTASHEMRTPVAAIEGYISLAMNNNVASIDERARGFLGKAHDSTQHLGELFRDLLTVTKVEEGKIAGQIQAFDLGKLVTDATGDMVFKAQEKKLTLLLKSGGQTLGDKAIMPLFTVNASPERLREVTMNLIENALKYTPAGGVTVDISGTKDTVTVRFIDTGIGISAEDIGHLFQKFYRVDSTATRTVGGTGLGLYLVRQVVEFYNGRVWVESELGRGSTFCFSLPRQANETIAATNVERINTEVRAPLIAVPVNLGQASGPSEVAK